MSGRFQVGAAGMNWISLIKPIAAGPSGAGGLMPSRVPDRPALAATNQPHRQPGKVFSQLAFAGRLATVPTAVWLASIYGWRHRDDPVALRDYRLHMAMIGWLSRQMPDVNIAPACRRIDARPGFRKPCAILIADAVNVAGRALAMVFGGWL